MDNLPLYTTSRLEGKYFEIESRPELREKMYKRLMKEGPTVWPGVKSLICRIPEENSKPVNFEKSLVKFHYPSGSWKSITLLKTLSNLGNESDVFTTKPIKKLLEHKMMRENRWIFIFLLI